MHRSLNRFLALVLGLQAVVFAAACGTSSHSDLPAAVGGSGGIGGAGGSGAAGGSGGSAAGGTGGSAGGGAGGGNLQAWIHDPAAWSLLPGQEDWDDLCSYSAADPDQIGFPALTWEACGEGCERTEVNHGYFDTAGRATLSSSAHDGVPLLRLAQGSLGDSIYVQRVINLSSGETLAVVKQVTTGRIYKDGVGYAACVDSAHPRSGVEFGAGRSFADGRPHVSLRGFWNRTDHAWLWQLPWQSVEERGFGTGYCSALSMEAGGRTFWACLDVVYGAVTPGSSAYEVLDTSSDGYVAAWSGDTMGELAIWSQKRGPQNETWRIRGWRPDGQGVRTLLDGIPVDTCEVGLSPTHVVAFSSAGCGYGADARLWIARRQEDDTLTDFRLGPIISDEHVAGLRLKAWGDYIAMGYGTRDTRSTNERGQLLVTRTSDWAMRELRAPADHELAFSTVTDRYVYAVPTGLGGRFSEVYRYDLEKFDEIGTPVTPVAEPAAPAQR